MRNPISSLKLFGWTSLDDDGGWLSAETTADEDEEETGKGALNENVDEAGSNPLGLDWDCCAVGFG